jgi:hypothetical protein
LAIRRFYQPLLTPAPQQREAGVTLLDALFAEMLPKPTKSPPIIGLAGFCVVIAQTVGEYVDQ